SEHLPAPHGATPGQSSLRGGISSPTFDQPGSHQKSPGPSWDGRERPPRGEVRDERSPTRGAWSGQRPPEREPRLPEQDRASPRKVALRMFPPSNSLSPDKSAHQGRMSPGPAQTSG